MVLFNFLRSIVKDSENWLLVFRNTARRGFLDLGSNRKTILGPREGKSWTTHLKPNLVFKHSVLTSRKTQPITIFFSPVALQSLKDLGRLTYRRFLDLFRQMVGLLGRVISPSQGLYLHRTTQYRETRTNIHALTGIRTHDPSNQSAKTHASDRTAIVTGTHNH
jgi:hypothetical protein